MPRFTAEAGFEEEGGSAEEVGLKGTGDGEAEGVAEESGGLGEAEAGASEGTGEGEVVD